MPVNNETKALFNSKALNKICNGVMISMKLYKNIDKKEIGKRIILNSLKLEESLAEVLRSEARLLRKRAIEKENLEEIQRINKVLKYVLFSLTMIDDRIKAGLELMEDNSSKSND